MVIIVSLLVINFLSILTHSQQLHGDWNEAETITDNDEHEFEE